MSLDEATAVDNTSWLCCHLYNKRVPVFVKLAMVNVPSTADALLQLLLDSSVTMLEGAPDQQRSDLASKLMGLGSDGASMLTGEFNGLIAKLRQYHALFVTSQHDAWHQTNLASAELDDQPF